MVNVQSGNISNYQKNLLDSATNFQNIFPALVNQYSSSITANESLKKSLEASDNMFNDLMTTQTNTGKDLSSLIEQRHQDSISYEAFSASLLEMNNELLEKQLSDIITQAQKDQETLSSQLNSIMGDDNDNDHNHKENSSAYLNVARQKIQELSEALKSQDNIAKDQSEQLDKIVREGLASYFAKNNKDNITLLELLKSHSTNEKTLKDFKVKVADFFTIDDDEKIAKFISRIKTEMSDRKKALSRYNVATAKLYRQVSGETMPQILIVIDSYEGLREAQTLTNLEACFQNISRDGSSLGISLVISAGRMAALRSSLMANLKERIALKLTDDSESRTLVGRHQHIMEDIPGRGLIKRDDIEVLQVALPTEGTETFDIINNIQNESDAMNSKWTGPRPKAIPIVPETLTFEEFKAYEDVKKASETNQISLGISLKEVDNCSIPLSKFKQLLFTSDNPDNLSNLTRFLVKSVSLIKDSKVYLLDTASDYDDLTEQQIEYINNRSEIAGHLEAIVSEIYLREESGKIEPWFVIIPDMNSFVAETNMDKEQILFLLDSAHKYHIYFLFGGLASYLMTNISDVPKAIRTQAQYVLLGMRVMDQSVLPKTYNSKEPYLKPDMIYIHDRRQETMLKITQEIEMEH